MISRPDEPALARLDREWRHLVTAGVPVALAGLAAARAVAHGLPETRSETRDWLGIMARDRPPARTDLAQVMAKLAERWPHGPVALPDHDQRTLTLSWPLLGSTEAIMETGGDIRLRRDPQTDLNGYGCSHRPRPWAITFASSTASSVSERGYRAADRARLRLTASMLKAGHRDAIEAEAQAVRRAIARSFGVPPQGAVVLAASGTDSELLALALAQMASPDRPITTILLAPEETGAGVPMAATGRHFAVDTANGHDVARAAPIAGYRADTSLHAIPLRDAAGQVRHPAAVDRDIEAAIEASVAAGRFVVLHVLDLSKTGLLAPSIGVLRGLRARFGSAFDIVVDACQLRLAPARIAGYLALDAVVQVTGSKFLTGPPFAGAALLPALVAARLEVGVLPRGLEAYFSKGDWPRGAGAAAGLPEGVNYGLVLRWVAALAEYRAFARVADARKDEVIAQFAETVARAIGRHGIFQLQAVPPLRRDGDGWDCRRTVFAFAVRAPDRPDRWLDPAAMRILYHWLNADCSEVFETASARLLAARTCHIGQPVALPDGAGGQVGWLRVSAGARLISGEPSHRRLAVARRLDREMADLATVFEKIALLQANWQRVAAVDPAPCYR